MAQHIDYGQCFQYWQYSAATKGDVQLNTPEVLGEHPNKISDPAYLSYYGPTVKEGTSTCPRWSSSNRASSFWRWR